MFDQYETLSWEAKTLKRYFLIRKIDYLTPWTWSVPTVLLKVEICLSLSSTLKKYHEVLKIKADNYRSSVVGK